MSEIRHIILDRDGVINHDSDHYIKSPDEWVAVDGSIEAIAALYQSGYKIAIASNQSGVGRGLFDIGTLNRIHDKMLDLISAEGGQVEGIFFCPHVPSEQCECRKPKPGLLLQIQDRLQFPLENTYFVGDSLKDIQTACAVNAIPVLVESGKGVRTLADPDYQPDLYGDDFAVYPDLATFCEMLLSGAD